MTGRGPCSAMRLSIYERNYASPPFDEKLINNGSAAHAWGKYLLRRSLSGA